MIKITLYYFPLNFLKIDTKTNTEKTISVIDILIQSLKKKIEPYDKGHLLLSEQAVSGKVLRHTHQ